MKKLFILFFIFFLVGCSKGGSTGDMLDDAEVALLYLGVEEGAPIEVESMKWFHILADVQEAYVDNVGAEKVDAYAYYIVYKVEGSSTSKYAFVATFEGKVDGYEVFSSLTAMETDYNQTIDELENADEDEDFMLAYIEFKFTSGEVDEEYFSGIEPSQNDIDNAPSIFDDAINLVLDTNTTVTFTVTIEERVYKFTPSETKMYKIYSTGDEDAYLEVYNENKEKIAEVDDVNGFSFSYSATLTSGETYYFLVGDYDGDDEYTIRIEEYVENTNSPFSDYTVILVNQTKNVYLASPASFKVFSFTPTTSGEYQFYSEGTDIDTRVTLYDSEGEYLSSQDDRDYSNNNLNFLIRYTLTAGETYYYEVGCWAGDINFTVTLIKS